MKQNWPTLGQKHDRSQDAQKRKSWNQQQQRHCNIKDHFHLQIKRIGQKWPKGILWKVVDLHLAQNLLGNLLGVVNWDTIQGAVGDYIKDVKSGDFPNDKEQY